MPSFTYEAYDTSGSRTRGVVSAANEGGVLSELASRGLQPIRVRERAERAGFSLNRSLSKRDLSNGYTQLGDLLSAGVPVLRALSLLARSKAKPKVAEAFRGIADVVSGGGEVSEAMLQRPDLFPGVHVAMVRAGETGGFLEQVFHRLGQFVAAEVELADKVKANMMYPAVLITMGTLILTIVFTVFVPMLEPILATKRETTGLPAITELLFAISGNALPVVSGLVVLVAGCVLAVRHPVVGRQVNIAATRAPVLGPLVRSLATIRFCRMLGTMEANGVPLLQAMGIAKGATGNVLMERAVEKAIEAVRAGEQVAPPLGESGLFSDDVVEMLRVGEESGHIDRVLLTIAETMERRIDRLLTGLTKLIEPLLLVTIAGVVLFVAAGILQPLMSMAQGLR